MNAEATAPDQTPPGYRTPQVFSATDVVVAAWGHFKEHAAGLMAAALMWAAAAAMVQCVPLTLTAVAPESVAFYGVGFGVRVASDIVSGYFGIGFARLGFAIVRGEHPPFGYLLAGKGFGRFVGLGVALAAPGWLAQGLDIVGAAIGAPVLHAVATWWSVLWLLPAALIWLPLSQSMYFIFDKNMSAGQAVRASIATTRGRRGSIFLASVVAGLIGVSGALGCCVGLVATVPLAMMIFPVIYARLTGQDPNADRGSQRAPYHPPTGATDPQSDFLGPPPPAGGFGQPPGD